MSLEELKKQCNETQFVIKCTHLGDEESTSGSLGVAMTAGTLFGWV